MQTKDTSNFEKTKRTSQVEPSLQNYFILKSYGRTQKEFKIKQSPYPMAIDWNHFYYSKNTKAFLKEFYEKINEKAIKKNGLKKELNKCSRELSSFNKNFKTHDEFVKLFEKEEHALNKINLIDDAIAKIKINVPNNDRLILSTPEITLNSEDALRIKKDKKSKDREIGVEYGWLAYEYLQENGFDKTGCYLREQMNNVNEERILANKKKNEAFIKNYSYPSESVKNFLENARLLRYVDCAYYKPAMLGRYKSREIRLKKASELGVTKEDVLFLMPWEKKVDTTMLSKRKTPTHVLLMNESDALNEF